MEQDYLWLGYSDRGPLLSTLCGRCHSHPSVAQFRFAQHTHAHTAGEYHEPGGMDALDGWLVGSLCFCFLPCTSTELIVAQPSLAPPVASKVLPW